MLDDFKAQFGGSITEEHKKIYSRSPRWNGKKFTNFSEPEFNLKGHAFYEFFKKQIHNRPIKKPKNNLEIIPFDKEKWKSENQLPQFIWYGHAALFLKLSGKNILIDPMLGDNTTPIAPIASKRYSKDTLKLIDEFPDIDAVFYTHDHYDHLDYDSVRKLKNKTRHFFVALGVGRHLESWGIPPSKITEFDWWEETNWEGIKITFTPTKHFSGRGPFDRTQSLWGGWVFQTEKHNIYWSGDGGYGEHFKEIGNKFDSFDWAFLECGQYNKLWPQVHMFPEESIQAGIDTNTKLSIPYHWGGFTLSSHPWKEPAERFVKAAQEKERGYHIPRLGEITTMNRISNTEHWYENIE